MRKFLCSLLILVLIFSSIVTCFASDSTDTVTFQLSEFDIINELKQMNDSELLEAGYTPEMIKELRNLNFQNEIALQKKKSNVELLREGYSLSEVNDIKSNSYQTAARAVAGKVTGTESKIT